MHGRGQRVPSGEFQRQVDGVVVGEGVDSAGAAKIVDVACHNEGEVVLTDRDVVDDRGLCSRARNTTTSLKSVGGGRGVGGLEAPVEDDVLKVVHEVEEKAPTVSRSERFTSKASVRGCGCVPSLLVAHTWRDIVGCGKVGFNA